jgi:hypothetical protein
LPHALGFSKQRRQWRLRRKGVANPTAIGNQISIRTSICAQGSQSICVRFVSSAAADGNRVTAGGCMKRARRDQQAQGAESSEEQGREGHRSLVNAFFEEYRFSGRYPEWSYSSQPPS